MSTPVIAPPRHIVTDALDADLMFSACTVEEVAANNRTDPYWDQLWAPGSQAQWFTGNMARHRSAAKKTRTRKDRAAEQDEAIRLLTSGRGRKERLAAWAVIDSWRTVTAEQLAAFTGSTLLLDPDYSSIAASFALNVLDLGSYSHPLARLTGNTGIVYRPSASDAFDRHITPTLTWPEWASVTGGMPWSAGGQYDRHNVLSTELALRAAEYLPIGTVLGEKFATVDLLCGAGLGKAMKSPDNRRADGVIVRGDGMRIAYELTATASKGFENKVRRWAKLLSERSLETSGLTILFIAAPHPDRSEHHDPRKDIYKAMVEVLKEFPGTGPDSPAARIGIADWQEYFPGKHQLSEAFFNLSADFALGKGSGPDRWIRRNLLTGYDFEPWHTFDATAVIANAPLLAATPHWLRTGDHTHLIGTPADRAGVSIPHPAPVRPHAAKGLALGESKGTAGAAKLPDRLRITG